MGTRNKSNLAFRGFASVSAFLLAFTSFGSVCAESYASQVNSFLGVKTTKMVSDTDTRIIYASSYGDFTEDNLKKLEADVYDHIEREEEEGAVLLSNDGTLPLETGKKVSLFGFAAYNPLDHTSAAGSRRTPRRPRSTPPAPRAPGAACPTSVPTPSAPRRPRR